MAKKAKKNDDFLSKEAKEGQATAETYTLDIPEDEIWTYQIEGLQAPHINKPFKNAGIKKVIVVIALIIAIGFAIYLSVRAVHNDMYQYNELADGTYELVKFTNPGDMTELVIDYVVDNETLEKDYSKPISAIAEFAVNCDETLREITLGKDVETIHGTSIYSCWWVTNVFVDDENPYLCDLNGVVYNKDITKVIFYPNDHDKAIRAQTGYDNLLDDDGNPMEELWGTTARYDEAFFEEYNKAVRTYVIPSTVKEIGQLAFAYSNITDLYIPEGVTTMESMAVFKNTVLRNIFSYTADTEIMDTTYNAIASMTSVYDSLPEGLESIGSDCFYYCRGLDYMYIPASVKEIGHHAFWNTCYLETVEQEDGKKEKTLLGVTEINVGADEETFKSETKTGDQWRPWYDYMLFKKSIDINYSAERR